MQTHPSNAYGIWKETAGGLTKVVRSGEQALSLPAGVNYYLPGTFGIDGAGRIVISVEAPDASTHGIYSEDQGTLRLVARETNQVPGQPAGVTFGNFTTVPLMNEAGSILFTSFIHGAGISSITDGLFTDRSGPLQLVVKNGDGAPGIPGATIIARGARPVFNDLGVIAFSGRYSGGTFPNDQAIWTEQSGTFTLLARSGQAPAGLPAGVVFGQLNEPRINNAGQVMFHSTLTGPGITSTNDAALWVYGGGDLQVIAREGSAAAGIGAGVNHGNIYYAYLNGAGKATFAGSLTGLDVTAQNDTALWSQRGDALTLIAREGDHASGTPAGVTFGDFTSLGGGGLGFQVNKSGQVAFQVTLTGPGVTAANDMGIWVTDLQGNLRLVAREGDLFDVSDDPNIEDLRTVRSTELWWYSGGGEDGYGSAFNNAGELANALSFTDSSGGAFVISTAVPEPSIVLMLPTALLFMRICRRYARR